MNKAIHYLKSRKKSYVINTFLFITGFIVVIFLFGPPKHYIVPILSMIVSYGFVELVTYRSWKKENH
ncbi:hypothetical protein NCCP2222_35170 [Sporosarcina sp. NCCP-2222]|nr:hypothetical protein NCCP2222_35170 [Sporosarcina sp. NCCP-2222]